MILAVVSSAAWYEASARSRLVATWSSLASVILPTWVWRLDTVSFALVWS